VGVKWKAASTLSATASTSGEERRLIFDGTQLGKSVEGHAFVDALTETQKVAVLEYLKTL
jgi:hypothetical protein